MQQQQSPSSSSSPFTSPPHPSSVSMVRKRTFQDMVPTNGTSSSSPGYNSTCSDSSPSSIAFTDYQYLSSPHAASTISTLASSSPMSRNASTQSCFSTFAEVVDQQHPYQQHHPSQRSTPFTPYSHFSPSSTTTTMNDHTGSAFDPSHLVGMSGGGERPGMKRRKTMPDTSPSSLLLSSPVKAVVARDNATPFTPRGNGKDGEDVWPNEVEDCFQTALRLLPRLGRKKLIIHGKPCGRNELIADYIFRHTGKHRTRKQVSSHIQVLKNLKKDDQDFMNLVSDPLEGEDQFAPGNAVLFFGTTGMGSPYAPPTFLERSLSASNIPHHPPIDLSANVALHGLLPPPPPSHSTFDPLSLGGQLHSPFIMQPSPSATTPTSGITRAMQGMSVALPTSPAPPRVACSIAPSRLTFWAETLHGEPPHVFGQLDASSGPTSTVYVEDLPLWEKRYSHIPAMNDHLPCQFLHAKVPLSIPTINGPRLAQEFKTHVNLTSIQALPLTAVTSIYCHGDSVITYEDTLTANPILANSVDQQQHPLDHQYVYTVPFGEDYWTMLFRGGNDGCSEPNFRKTTKERQSLADMLPGFSVVQEFVVPSESAIAPQVDGETLSPGCAMGDVVLVVCYDLEVVKTAKPGVAELSYLSVRRSTAGPSYNLSTSNSMHHHGSYEVPQIVTPCDASTPSTARPSMSPHKPNLSLHIPSPSQFTRRASSASTLDAGSYNSNHSSVQPSPSALMPNGPITPFGQVVHTPTHPPPVLPPPSAVADAQRDRSRLEAIWRSNAADTNHGWDLDSPALYPPPHASQYTSQYVSQDDHYFSSSSMAPAAPATTATSSDHLQASYPMDRRSLSTPALFSRSSSRSLSPRPPLSSNTSSIDYTMPAPSSLSANVIAAPSPIPRPEEPYQESSLSSFDAVPQRSSSTASVVSSTTPLKISSGQSKPFVANREKQRRDVVSAKEQDAFFSSLLGATTRYTVSS